MVEFPENVHEIVKKAARRYPDNIPKAVEVATDRIRKLKNFDELVDLLVTSAIQEMVYDVRHTDNTAIKNKAGRAGGKTKVKGTSSKVKEVYESAYFSLRIGGSLLGLLTGEDLSQVAGSEGAIAKGHTFNSRLCYRLAKIVPRKKTVRESVSSKKLDDLVEEIKNAA